MTQIIGFAGKKQSGKNTCSNFLLMLKLHEYGVCKQARLDLNGNIVVSDIFGETVSGSNGIPLTKEYVDVDALFSSFNPCKIYSFADELKKLCINILGIPKEYAYGSDADKNELTNLLWENMPGVVTNISPNDIVTQEVRGRLGDYYSKILDDLIYHKPGRMTVREVLQFVGTEIFRRMYHNVWIDSCLRTIKKDSAELAIICDVRFPNEISAIKENGGIVIGLPRDIYVGSDSHASEKINFELCDYVLSEGDITHTTKELYTIASKYHTFKSKVG